MINFTVGPVQSSEGVREIGSRNVPYFRTPEFSSIMQENERLIKEFVNAEDDARAIFITGSGTASMEATVMNIFNAEDKVLVVNGGSFGQRFADLCKIYDIPFDEIVPEPWKGISKSDLEPYAGKGYTGFLVNINETSTGVLYDINIISNFCKQNNIFLVVDAISSFLCDPLNMKLSGVDVIITGSQKALACPPGISVIVLSKTAIERVNNSNVRSMYFDLKNALKNGERGQTPFTPAVGVLLQINERLNEIKEHGGVESEIIRISKLATDFRSKIKALPFEIASESLPNAVTSLRTTTASATDIFRILKDEYGIWICPNGGKLAETIFRVGHIGALTLEDNNKLICAFEDMKKRKLI